MMSSKHTQCPDALIVYVSGRVVQKGAPIEVFSNPLTEEVEELASARDKCRMDTVPAVKS